MNVLNQSCLFSLVQSFLLHENYNLQMSIFKKTYHCICFLPRRSGRGSKHKRCHFKNCHKPCKEYSCRVVVQFIYSNLQPILNTAIHISFIHTNINIFQISKILLLSGQSRALHIPWSFSWFRLCFLFCDVREVQTYECKEQNQGSNKQRYQSLCFWIWGRGLAILSIHSPRPKKVY